MRFTARSMAVALLMLVAPPPLAVQAGGLPEIRSSPMNSVPRCITPERLMAFVVARNPQLPARYGSIAATYRDIGESARVRWDYAFFQMLLETNYLKFQRGDGSSGDVGANQNNFAGIGATGGGVPGDRYADVRTGVLAHIQHLVAYSGERVERPVAQRTREHQGDIIDVSRRLGRPVTFSDLSRRWAVDRAYATNIETIAGLFRKSACADVATLDAKVAGERPMAAPSKLGAGSLPDTPGAAPRALVRTVWQRGEPVPPAPQPVQRAGRVGPSANATAGAGAASAQPVLKGDIKEVDRAALKASGLHRFAAIARMGLGAALPPTGADKPAPAISVPSPVGAAAQPCRLYSASYGGTGAVLIRHRQGQELRLTAVEVEPGARDMMAGAFIGEHAPDGEILGYYDTKAAALGAARSYCPAG